MFDVPCVSFDDLRDHGETAIRQKINAACIAGALIITNVPNLEALRSNVLRTTLQFSTLPEAIKAKYERPDILFSDGWSHGKEKLKNNQPDTSKGSFYFNPYASSQKEGEKNLYHDTETQWPSEVPQMKEACTSLTELIVSVADRIVSALDAYLSSIVEGFVTGSLVHILQSSKSIKGRCLCYFPIDPSTEDSSFWCTEHVDHCVLTVSAMYFDRNGTCVSCPDPNCGLYIRDESGKAHRVTYPEHALFFQFGEALQILSGGHLPATRHYVTPIQNQSDVYRVTFALFFNPDVDTVLSTPTNHSCGIIGFQPGQTFGQFSSERFRQYN